MEFIDSFIQRTVKRIIVTGVCVIKQAYKRYKKSLCLVSANVSTMKEEYFHHKTTPDFPIVLAVRSTNSLPGI